MPHNFSHTTITTSNPSNLYSISVIEDPNVLDLNSPAIEYTSSGLPFYTIEITPNDFNNIYSLVISGNFTIDGITSSWSWDADLGNGQGNNGCYPPDPPYYNGYGAPNTIIKNSISHPYVLTGSTCWPSPFVGNGTYRFQGPYIFDNSAYCDGDFQSSSSSVTWRKIILIDVYEMSLGFLANGDLSPAIEEDETKWVTASVFNNYLSNVQNNGFPKFLRAFVFPEYHPTNPLTADMHIDLDFDYFAGTAGCTDPNSSTYDPLAEISNPDMCSYGPAPLDFPPLVITSDISPSNHTVYNVVAFNGGSPMLGGPYQMLVLENFEISIPTPTGGTPPYQDYEIGMLGDNVNTNGSPSSNAHLITSSGTVPPSRIIVIDDTASTFDPATNTYTDCVTINLPEAGYPDISAGPGVYNIGKIILDAIHPSAGVTANAVQDITISASVEDDAGTSVTTSVSADIASQYN